MALILISTLTLMMISLLWFSSATIFGKKTQLFWIITSLGAFTILVMHPQPLPFIQSAWFGDGAINPIRILGLFFSFTILAIFLDEVGLIKYLAYLAIHRAGYSQTRLFFIWFWVVAIATTLTANDIVVLTLTPFIIYVARHAKVSPLPYIISQFVSANTWSMLLIIGNPTNIYLASKFQIDFLSYVSIMWLPTLFTGLGSLGLLYVIFRSSFSQPLNRPDMVINRPHSSYRLGLLMLGVAIGLMTLSQWIGIGMDVLTILSAVLLIIMMLMLYPKAFHLGNTLRRLPFEMLPFFLSMAILVNTFDVLGWTDAIANGLINFPSIYSFGISSFFASNLINNIPMSLWYSNMLMGLEVIDLPAVYASIIGSNLGAILTPVGALAGLMWMSILKAKQVALSFGRFVLYGIVIGPVLLMIALWTLDLIYR
jgi:arsenical pump membrane protein